MKLISTLLLSCSITVAFSQLSLTDTLHKAPYGITDNYVTFAYVLQTPKYKNGINALADMLTDVWTKNRKTATYKTVIDYRLRITNTGAVDYVNLTVSQNNTGLDSLLRASLLQTSGMWEPARQDGMEVNAFKYLSIVIAHHKINIRETP